MSFLSFLWGKSKTELCLQQHSHTHEHAYGERKLNSKPKDQYLGFLSVMSMFVYRQQKMWLQWLSNRSFSHDKTTNAAVSVGSMNWPWRGQKPHGWLDCPLLFHPTSSPCVAGWALHFWDQHTLQAGRRGKGKGLCGLQLVYFTRKAKAPWNLPQWLLLRTPWWRWLAVSRHSFSQLPL